MSELDSAFFTSLANIAGPQFGFDIVGKVAAVPVSAIGLTIGLSMVPLGARPTIGSNAIVFNNLPFGMGAMTIGNVILYSGNDLSKDTTLTYFGREQYLASGIIDPSQIIGFGPHEMAHTFQFEALGPLFYPVYFLNGGISAGNRFEYIADQYALRGGSYL